MPGVESNARVINRYSIRNDEHPHGMLFDDLHLITIELPKLGNDPGRLNALDKGIRQGREEGIAKGIEQGIEQGKIDAARKMKAENVPIENIARWTGLTLEQISEL